MMTILNDNSCIPLDNKSIPKPWLSTRLKNARKKKNNQLFECKHYIKNINIGPTLASTIKLWLLQTIIRGQYGFREGHSISLVLLELIEDISREINNIVITTGIFIYLKKAFDTIDHSILFF